MGNTVKNLVVDFFAWTGQKVFDIFCALLALVFIILACRIAWHAVAWGAMLLPEGATNFIIAASFVAIVATILWKIKEVLALLAVACHIFS